MSSKYITVNQSIDLDYVSEIPEDVKKKLYYLKRLAIDINTSIFKTNKGLHLFIILKIPKSLYQPWLPTFLTAYLSNDPSLAVAEYIIYAKTGISMIHKPDSPTIKGKFGDIHKVEPQHLYIGNSLKSFY